MIRKIYTGNSCEITEKKGQLEILTLIRELDRHDKEYYVGIDYADVDSIDSTSVVWSTISKDGIMNVEGNRLYHN